MTAPAYLTTRPFAHRGLHDISAGRIENSLCAFRAAIAAGYGIELDVQPSADGVAMVFHDYTLDRLTAKDGPIRAHTAIDLQATTLTGGQSSIPTLDQVLDLVAGQVPLLIEIKDQDGKMGPNVGALERAIVQSVQGYCGDLALMSFNPHSVAAFADLAPERPRGIVTSDYAAHNWPNLPASVRHSLRPIPDYDRTGSCFISHQASDLSAPRVAALKSQGAAILCWTIRSQDHETTARKVAHNITFEGYTAA